MRGRRGACLTTLVRVSETKKQTLASTGLASRRSGVRTTDTGSGSRAASAATAGPQSGVGEHAGVDAGGEIAQLLDARAGLLEGGRAQASGRLEVRRSLALGELEVPRRPWTFRSL